MASTLPGVGSGGASGGFEWWAPHDRALRRARLLLATGAVVVASYLIVPLTVLLVVIRGGFGSFSGRDWAVIVVASVAVLAAVAAVIAVVGARGLRRRVHEWAGARLADADELHLLAPTLGPFALARGMPVPRVWVVDDDAPNAFAFARAGSPHLCVTRGALALPPNELSALAAFEMTALTCPPFTACVAAIDLVLFAEWCVRVLWMLPVLVLLTTVVGVPPLAAAVFAACFAALVAVTRLVLFFADRVLPDLLDDAAELVDLETVRVTELPADLAHLLTRIAGGDRRVRTGWQVAHRWFDRRERELAGSAWIDPPALADRCEHGTASNLLARAQLAARQAGVAVVVEPPPRRWSRRRTGSRRA